MKKISMITNMMFVVYKPQNIFADYLPGNTATVSPLIELPNELIRTLEQDKDQKIELLFFDGSYRDKFIWVNMRGGDNFFSFMQDISLRNGRVLILIPEEEKKKLSKDFVEIGYSVLDYGKKGLQPSSFCRILYEDEGAIRTIEKNELACAN